LRLALTLCLALSLSAAPARARASTTSDAHGAPPAPGDIIINEYVADGGDFIELLTLKSGLDLRGLRLSDNELISGTLNSGEAVWVFGADAYLDNVPAGATIVISTTAAGTLTDTTISAAANDWSLTLAPGTGVSVSTDGLGGSSSSALATSGEALYLFLPGPNGNSAGTDNVYLDFVSFKSDGGSAPAGLVDLNLTSPADNAFYTGNTASGNDVAANWTGYAIGSAPIGAPSPGQANPGQDLTTLRGGVADVAPTVSATTPPDGATDVAADADIGITFSEAVTVTGEWVRVQCDTSGQRTLSQLTITGGPTAYTINPDSDFEPNELCAVTVFADGVTDRDNAPNEMAVDYSFSFTIGASAAELCARPYTRTFEIQGAGATSPLSGTQATVQGIVIGDYEVPAGDSAPSSYLRGFYLQDPTGDGITTTSDGLFVFNANNDSVSPGDHVRVTGLVQEFQSQTQLGGAVSIVRCATGQSVEPTSVVLPFTSTSDPERFEGMLVRLPQNLTVTEHFQLARFGEVRVSSGGRLRAPTQSAAPGVAAQALADANALNTLILDDGSQRQNPDPIQFARDGGPLSAARTLRGGDTIRNATGVFGFTWGGASASPNAYRVRLTVPAQFESKSDRPSTPSAPVSGTIRIAGANLLNFFNTFDNRSSAVDNCAFGVGGAPADCRGADDAAEFSRQISKTVAMLTGTGADIIGVNEIENDGYDASSALRTLVDALNAASAPGTYAYVDVDASAGVTNALGVDAIKVGLIYKPARVELTGKAATLTTGAFGPITLTNGTAQQRNRPPLAQTFRDRVSGQLVTVAINHFKSKGSSCADQVAPIASDPDANDGQGNCNRTRTAAAQQLAAWLATQPTGVTTTNQLIIGDLNAYALEDPVSALRNAGYVNLVAQRLGPDAYSFVFNGAWGYLDHALATPVLVSQITTVLEWHINADEPNALDYNVDFKTAAQQVSLYAPDRFRTSDHDPILVDVRLSATPRKTWLPLAAKQ
jgi:hypothetical protein